MFFGAGNEAVKTVATRIRCVPRIGYDNTEVRTIDVGLPEGAESDRVRDALDIWFMAHGIDDAVFDIAFDNDGIYAVINDEAYDASWGKPLF